MHRSNRLVLGRTPQHESVVELAEDEGWQQVEDVVEDGVRQSAGTDRVRADAFSADRAAPDDRQLDRAVGRDAFGSSEDWVREAAIWATAYSAWPQDLPLLEVATGNDPSEKLRSDASAVLEGLRTSG
ncbi:hypothetical protein OHB24_11280 [Kribbella sp. NBC_00482]|uniref:hypothetical protein n=1 Tax=Kribbella sp. NBC_00482 TaxID=2975968 RepID=UPI002E193A66